MRGVVLADERSGPGKGEGMVLANERVWFWQMRGVVSVDIDSYLQMSMFEMDRHS